MRLGSSFQVVSGGTHRQHTCPQDSTVDAACTARNRTRPSRDRALSFVGLGCSLIVISQRMCVPQITQMQWSVRDCPVPQPSHRAGTLTLHLPHTLQAPEKHGKSQRRFCELHFLPLSAEVRYFGDIKFDGQVSTTVAQSSPLSKCLSPLLPTPHRCRGHYGRMPHDDRMPRIRFSSRRRLVEWRTHRMGWIGGLTDRHGYSGARDKKGRFPLASTL
jgi:hypothetical protein